MRCPNCGSKINKNNICDNCKIKFKYEKTNYNKFLFLIIIIGILLIGIILYFLYFKCEPKKNTTVTTTIKKVTNKGSIHSYLFPASIGEVALSKYYDGKKYYDVDVTGIRFMDTSEASNYYQTDNDSFTTYGFVYEVTFNDLNGIKNIDPVLDSYFKLDNGNTYITIDEKNYEISTKNFYNGGKINNNESAEIMVLYAVPNDIKNYSICVGDDLNNLACFRKDVVEE